VIADVFIGAYHNTIMLNYSTSSKDLTNCSITFSAFFTIVSLQLCILRRTYCEYSV